MRVSLPLCACVSALMLIVLPLRSAAQDNVVRLKSGESVSVDVYENRRRVQVRSENPTVARVRFGADRLTIIGANAGTTHVIIEAELENPVAGFKTEPKKVSPRRAEDPDLAELSEELHRITVVVEGGRGGLADAIGGEMGAGTAASRPTPPALSVLRAHDYVVVRVGKTISATFPKQTSGARGRSADPGVATVGIRDEKVTINGIRPGRTTITLTGEYVKHLMGFTVAPQQSAPINGNRPFEQIYIVDVLPIESAPSPAENRRTRLAPPSESTVVYELCINGRKSLTLPQGIGPVEAIVPGNVVTVETVTVGGQQSLRLIPRNRGIVLVRVREKPKTQTINKLPYDESFHVRVVPEDLSGEWIGEGGFEVEHRADGTVMASFSRGRVFQGTLTGRALKLVFAYTEEAQMPANWPAEARKFMMGKPVVIEAQIKDPDSPGGLGDSHMVGTIQYNEVGRRDGEIVVTPRTRDISFQRREPHGRARTEAGLK